MNNLFMWEYQGKTEIGFAPSESDRRGNYFLYAIGWGVSQTRNRAYVTNLRPAKVAEADAYDPTPPVTEPKNFGAIVEAGVDGFGNRVPLVSINGRWWSRNNLDFSWSDLINPVIKSEGLDEVMK